MFSSVCYVLASVKPLHTDFHELNGEKCNFDSKTYMLINLKSHNILEEMADSSHNYRRFVVYRLKHAKTLVYFFKYNDEGSSQPILKIKWDNVILITEIR